jgi:hypothetical protein
MGIFSKRRSLPMMLDNAWFSKRKWRFAGNSGVFWKIWANTLFY